MIVVSFDGRNVNTIFDGTHLKVINEFLKLISAEQAEFVSNAMRTAGFKTTPAECAALAVSVNAAHGNLLDAINMHDVHEAQAEEEQEADVLPVKKKKKATPKQTIM